MNGSSEALASGKVQTVVRPLKTAAVFLRPAVSLSMLPLLLSPRPTFA